MEKAKKAKKFTKYTKDVLERQLRAFLKSLPEYGSEIGAGAAEDGTSEAGPQEAEETDSSDEEFQSLDESDITSNLPPSRLSLELNNRFPELFNLRQSVILLSHCAGRFIILN